MIRMLGRAAAPLCAAVLAGGVLVQPASAHTGLKSASPAKNSTVASPAQITLTYSDPVTMPRIVVTDSAGNRQEAGAARAVDNKVTQPLRAGLASGRVTVGWRVVSADGHPITGTYKFTVKGSGAAAPAGSPAVSHPPGHQGHGTTTTSGDQGSQSSSGWLWIGLVALLAAGLVGGLSLARRRRAGPQTSGGAEDSGASGLPGTSGSAGT